MRDTKYEYVYYVIDFGEPPSEYEVEYIYYDYLTVIFFSVSCYLFGVNNKLFFTQNKAVVSTLKIPACESKRLYSSFSPEVT